MSGIRNEDYRLLRVDNIIGQSYTCMFILRTKQRFLFQSSTVDALLARVCDGDLTYQELQKHGDFGIGTLNGLDGEMIGIEGKFYQIKTDEVAYYVDDSMKYHLLC